MLTIPGTKILKYSFVYAVKLISVNYYMWKSDIEISLEGANLLEIVLSNEAPPTNENS
jgi:hypothetical protein